MKTLAQTLVAASILFFIGTDSAQAHVIRHLTVYDAQEVAKQQRANMAERTHQIKELQESARVNSKHRAFSAAETVKNYPTSSQNARKRALWKMRLARANSVAK